MQVDFKFLTFKEKRAEKVRRFQYTEIDSSRDIALQCPAGQWMQPVTGHLRSTTSTRRQLCDTSRPSPYRRYDCYHGRTRRPRNRSHTTFQSLRAIVIGTTTKIVRADNLSAMGYDHMGTSKNCPDVSSAI